MVQLAKNAEEIREDGNLSTVSNMGVQVDLLLLSMQKQDPDLKRGERKVRCILHRYCTEF